jgi:hypothetical protein
MRQIIAAFHLLAWHSEWLSHQTYTSLDFIVGLNFIVTTLLQTVLDKGAWLLSEPGHWEPPRFGRVLFGWIPFCWELEYLEDFDLKILAWMDGHLKKRSNSLIQSIERPQMWLYQSNLPYLRSTERTKQPTRLGQTTT